MIQMSVIIVKMQILPLVLFVMLIAMVPFASAIEEKIPGTSEDALEIDKGEMYRLLGSGFIPNMGQYDPEVAYVLQYQRTTIYFTRAGLVLTHTSENDEGISGDVIRQTFSGASPDTRITAQGERPGRVNYYVGNDSSQWLTGIPVYAEIVYNDLYPGIDLVYSEENGRLKREFRVAPGASPGEIGLLYDEEVTPSVDDTGILRFTSPAGEMLESPLICWQLIGGEVISRTAVYLVEEGSVRIVVAGYDPGYELIIDPELVYSSYFGGSNGYGTGQSLVPDGNGGVWVAGHTNTFNFPVTPDAYQSSQGGNHDTFVSRFSSTGALLYSTYLGGSLDEDGKALAPDGNGGIWVAGYTWSSNFPVTVDAYQNSRGGGESDGFVSRFSSTGALLYSTYLGASGSETGYALAPDGNGGVWVAGQTNSLNFPVTPDAYQSSYGGEHDAFVSRFSSTGALLYSTYLGGSGWESYECALAPDGSGGVWVAGSTWSPNFPVTVDAYQSSHSGGYGDAFVSRFSSTGALLYSTYLGGSGWDHGYALAPDGSGGVWVAGWNQLGNFPMTADAYQSSHGGGDKDAFLSRFSSTGALLYSTYLGGSGIDDGSALAPDGSGGVWVAGITWSSNFPVTADSYQSSHGGGDYDAFLSRFSSTGALLYSTYLGGSNQDGGNALAPDGSSGVWVTGYTLSTDFPVTADAYQGDQGGGWYPFLTRFSDRGSSCPTPNFTTNITRGVAPLCVQFNDISSIDMPLSWNWSFGNGQWINTTEESQKNVTFCYNTPGNYLTQLTVHSNEGVFKSSPKIITVTPLIKPSYIKTWGSNISGQCESPQDNDFVAIAGGYNHSIALRSNGSIVAWGENVFGVCDVPAGNDYIAIDTGEFHNLALKSDGSIVAWGQYSMVPAGNDFVAIAAGSLHSLALRSNGTIVAWGNNFEGACDVPTDNGFVAIAAGRHSLALRSNGSLVAWGDNSVGQYNVPPGNDFVAIAASSWHSMAMRSDGSLEAWGFNAFGQCDVPAGNDFKAISTGFWHSIALRQNGSILAWGYNGNDECNIPIGNGYEVISAGSWHNLALQNISNAAPIADFEVNQTNGYIPLVVQFTDTSQNTPTSWYWEFGDGNISTLRHPQYTYTAAGTYTVNLTVTNAGGSDSEVKTDFITVTGSSVPVADFTGGPLTGYAPLNVAFTDRSTGSPSAYTWFFGDEDYSGLWTEMNLGAGWAARNAPSSITTTDGSIILMGGGATYGFMNDVWQSDDNGATWILINASAGWEGRFCHTTVLLPDNNILLMGGANNDLKNDVWRSMDRGITWTQVNASAGWVPRLGHTSVAMPDGSIVLMGGHIGNTYINDVWRSTDDGATWSLVNVDAEWTPRYLHSSVVMPDGSIILMGGWDTSVGALNDVWRSTDLGATWTQLTASAGWSRRSAPSIVMPDGSILLIGGGGPSGIKNDVWRSTDNGATWALANPNASWIGRGGHTCEVLKDGSIVLMGGMDSTDTLRNDVWRLVPAGSSAQNPSHSYTTAGTYTVSLTVSNAAGSDSEVKADFITVSGVGPTPTPTPVPGSDKISLNSGWNFISTPKTLADGMNTAGVVFAGVDTNGRSIYLYNAEVGLWVPMTASSIVRPLDGIWIYSTTAVDLPLTFKSGGAATPPTKNVYFGWNAIGFSDVTSRPAKSALITIDDPPRNKWSMVIGWNAASQVYESAITNIDPENTAHLQPTKGYWLFMNGDQSYYPWVLASLSS